MSDPTLPRESDPVLAALTEKRGYPLDNGAFMKFRDGYYVRWPDIEAAIRSRPVEEGWTDQRIAEVFGGWFEDGMWQGSDWSIQGIVETMGPALRASGGLTVDDPTLPRESDPEPGDYEAMWFQKGYEAAIRSRPVEEGEPLLEITHYDEDDSWGVSIRAMPGHVGAGRTLTEAYEAAHDAALAWLAARPVEVDPERLRVAMSIVLGGNRDAAWFVLAEKVPDYIAERIAIEYAALSSPEPRKP